MQARDSIVSPTVLKLTLLMTPSTNFANPSDLAATVNHITSSMPNVERLSLVGDGRIRDRENEISLLCKSMKHLRIIILPPAAMTLSILDAFARIPTLETVRLAENDPSSHYTMTPIVPTALLSSCPALQQNAFPTIINMALTAPTPYILRPFVSQHNFPGYRLRALWLRFTLGPFVPRMEVRSLLACLRASCANLEDLTLRLGPYSASAIHTVIHLEPIYYADIAGAFKFEHLKHLYIDHTAAIIISTTHISQIAKNASRLRTLWLNPHPAISLDERYLGALPISSLGYFAKHCPQLESLGLYLDAIPKPSASSALPDTHGHRFVRLSELFVGSSPITTLNSRNGAECSTQWRKVANCLARVLPRWTEITTAADYAPAHPMNGITARTRPYFVAADGTFSEKAATRRAWMATRAFSHFLAERRNRLSQKGYAPGTSSLSIFGEGRVTDGEEKMKDE